MHELRNKRKNKINKTKDLEKSNNLNNACKANIYKTEGKGITFQGIRGHDN